jgi:hypothetical protein
MPRGRSVFFNSSIAPTTAFYNQRGLQPEGITTIGNYVRILLPLDFGKKEPALYKSPPLFSMTVPPQTNQMRRGAMPGNAKRIDLERAAPKALLDRRTRDFEEVITAMTPSSGFRLRKVFYSVTSRLDHRLHVRLFDDRLDLFMGGARWSASWD